MCSVFSENDIRPTSLDAGKVAAIEDDLKFLISKKNRFVSVCCPACNKSKYQTIYNKYSFKFVQCKDCDTVFMTPRATAKILKEFYSHSKLYEYWNKFIFPSSIEIRREKIFKPRVDRIIKICEKYNIPTNCVVEVGAGFGIFCEELIRKKYFKRVIAIEPHSDLANTCRTSGIEVVEDTIENIEQPKYKANVLAAFEVIEHLFSPQEFIKNCVKLLEDNSIMILTCPNYKGFDIEPLAKNSDSIDAEHINMFNPDSLKLLLNRCGLKVLECTTPGELDAEILRTKVLKNEYSLDDQPFLRTVLIDRWDELGRPFQKFLNENKLSSHMWVVATPMK
jgi:2-polyprenyl-3-methyl-5-hydroxy-6-metoxy-1,4-benzoquinol methylase